VRSTNQVNLELLSIDAFLYFTRHGYQISAFRLVREEIRLKHYSIRTEQAYLDWIKRFILFSWQTAS
jgi:hypothetical protein